MRDAGVVKDRQHFVKNDAASLKLFKAIVFNFDQAARVGYWLRAKDAACVEREKVECEGVAPCLAISAPLAQQVPPSQKQAR